METAQHCNIGSFLGTDLSINSVTLSRSPLSTPHMSFYINFIHNFFSRIYGIRAHDGRNGSIFDGDNFFDLWDYSCICDFKTELF